MMPYPELGTITDEDRAAVTRLVSGERDADVILELLFGDVRPSIGWSQRQSRAIPSTVTAAQRAEVRRLRANGRIIRDIADRTGLRRQTVSLILREET